MPKLHEILAVESDRTAAANAAIAETTNTFAKKPHHYMGHQSSYAPFAEDDTADSELDTLELVDTVQKKLEFTLGLFGRGVDVQITKEKTNQSDSARADVEVDGFTLLRDMPATALLALEARLKVLLPMFHQIPTLAPGKQWAPAPDIGAGVYRDVQPEVKVRTKKEAVHETVVQATQYHPAQVVSSTKDIPVGKTTKYVWSGMVSPARKSQLIGRLQALIGAVREARCRANCAEIIPADVGADIQAFLLAE